MKFLSLFSGVECASLAFNPLGWECVAVSEIEPFPSAVIKYHFPDLVNHGDVSKVDWTQYRGSVDVVCGGSPCQSFSVAGLRQGLDDPRGNLMLEFLRAVDTVAPKWVIWENVPGVFSTNNGEDFRTFVAALTELGYGVCWRVLDAQWFGLAQRRRRVFVVGYLGDWRPAAAVLFEPSGLFRHFKTSREARESLARSSPECSPEAIAITGNIIGRAENNGGNGRGFQRDIAYTLTSTDQHGVLAIEPSQMEFGLGNNVSPTLRKTDHGGTPVVLPFDTGNITSKDNGSNPQWGDPCHTIVAQHHPPAIVLADDNEKCAIDIDMCGTLKVGGGAANSPCINTDELRDRDWFLTNSYGASIQRPAVSFLASGNDTTGTICANCGDKQFLGNQEAFSGDFHVIERYKMSPFRLRADCNGSCFQQTAGTTDSDERGWSVVCPYDKRATKSSCRERERERERGRTLWRSKKQAA